MQSIFILSIMLVSVLFGGYTEKRFGWWSWIENNILAHII